MKMVSKFWPPNMHQIPLEVFVNGPFFSIFQGNWILTPLKGCRMGRSDKVSLWYVASLINTRFCFFILE